MGHVPLQLLSEPSHGFQPIKNEKRMERSKYER